MPEWTNGLAWKASVPLTGTEGSNPSLSADTEPDVVFGFFYAGLVRGPLSVVRCFSVGNDDDSEGRFCLQASKRLKKDHALPDYHPTTDYGPRTTDLMISSMTGFGRGSAQVGSFTATVEMRSVNNRYLDVPVRLPRKLNGRETDIQTRVKNAFDRGRMEVQVEVERIGEAELQIQVNEKAARAYGRLLEDLRRAAGIEEPLGLEHIIRYNEVFVTAEEDEAAKEQMWQAIEAALAEAIEQMRAMRRQEGRALQADLESHLNAIEETLSHVEERAPDRVSESQQRLRDRLEDLLRDDRVDEERLIQEIAILADKLDINEECVRLHSHLDLFREALASDEPVGRKLNFIVQEIHREVNTISSKANDAHIAHLAVGMKEDVEKIREQIQNVE